MEFQNWAPRVLEVLAYQGRTRQWLASRIGPVDRGQFSHLLLGTGGYKLTERRLELIGEALGVPPGWLLEAYGSQTI